MSEVSWKKMHQMEKGEYKALNKGEEETAPFYEEPIKVQAIKPLRRSFSCTKCICFTFLFLVILLSLISGGIALWVRHQVIRFTVESPKMISDPAKPPKPVTKAEMKVKFDEIELFWDQLMAGKTPEKDLILTEDSVNGWIALNDHHLRHRRKHSNGHHNFAPLSVSMKDRELSVHYVVPTDGLPGGKGRFLAGTVKVMDDGQYDGSGRWSLQVLPDQPVDHLNFETILDTTVEVSKNERTQHPVLLVEAGHLLNWVIPQDWVAERQNLLDCDLYKDDDDSSDDSSSSSSSSSDSSDSSDDDECDVDCATVAAALAHIESVTLEEGQLVIRPKRSSSSTEIIVVDAMAETEPVGPAHRRLSAASKNSGGLRAGVLVRRVLQQIM